MNLCDSNIWLALTLSAHIHHRAAKDWLDSVTEPASVIFCRATQQSFLRLLTNQAVLGAFGNAPLTNRQAWEIFELLLADDRIVLRSDEPAGISLRWKVYSSRDTASPKMWMDSYLAAFALSAQSRMITNDAAYKQFDGLDLLVLGRRD